MKSILAIAGFMFATASLSDDFSTIQCRIPGSRDAFYIGILQNIRAEDGVFYIDFEHYSESYASDPSRTDCTFYYTSPAETTMKRDINVGVLERSGTTTSIVCGAGSTVHRFATSEHLIRDGLKDRYGEHPTIKVDGLPVATRNVAKPQCIIWKY